MAELTQSAIINQPDRGLRGILSCRSVKFIAAARYQLRQRRFAETLGEPRLRQFAPEDEKMKQTNTQHDTAQSIYDLPEPAWIKPAHPDRYGQVTGLDPEELADPEELERVVWRGMWEPVLRLPDRYTHHGLRPELDEQGDIDWGAFGTIDFLRDRSVNMDKARYKLNCLQEALKDQIIMMSLVRARLKGTRYAQVLNLLKQGVIDMDHISDFWMKRMAMRYFKARALKEEIRELKGWLCRAAAP